jgi:outer membrane lipase/esterase
LTMLLAMAASVSMGAPPLPPTATLNIISVANALQNACNQLASPTNAVALTPAQQDLSARCAFFENPAASNTAALQNGYYAIVGQQVNALGPQTKKFATLQQDDVTARLAELRHGAHGSSLLGLNLRGDDGRLLAANNVADFLPADSSGNSGGSGSAPVILDGRLGIFVNGSVKVGSKVGPQGKMANSFNFDIDDSSLTAGADYRITDWFVAGAAYSGGKTKTVFKNDLGRLDLDAKGLSVFASFYGTSYYLDILAGYGRTDLTTDRNLNFTEVPGGTTIDQQALGSSRIHDLWAGLSVGDALHWRQFSVTPEGSLNFHEIRLDGFTESMSQPSGPGTGLALSYSDAVVPSLQGRLGLRLGYTASTAWGVFEPQIHGTFIREFRNRADTFTARFAAVLDLPGGGTPAFIHTDAPEGHYFANGGGISAQFAHGVAAFFDYEQLRTLKTIKSHEFSFGVRWQVGD